MEDLWLPKSLQPRQKWLCLWEDENGKVLINDDHDYLCAESWEKGDPLVEEKMRKAASLCGVDRGGPRWIKGRKITQTEWEVQMERLLAGEIPDEQEAYLAALEEQYVQHYGVPRKDQESGS